MPRQPFFVRLTSRQTRTLNRFLKSSLKSYGLRPRRRAQAVWFSSQDWMVCDIAKRLKTSERSVWKWLKGYQAKGVSGLKGQYFSHKI